MGAAKNEYRGIAVKDGHALIDKRIHLSWIGRYNFSTLNCVWSKKEIAFAQIWKRRSDIKIRWHSILKNLRLNLIFIFLVGVLPAFFHFACRAKYVTNRSAVYFGSWAKSDYYHPCPLVYPRLLKLILNIQRVSPLTMAINPVAIAIILLLTA